MHPPALLGLIPGHRLLGFAGPAGDARDAGRVQAGASPRAIAQFGRSMIDGDDFVLDAVGEGPVPAPLPNHWCFDGRAFGGYTAAMALAAVLEVAGGSGGRIAVGELPAPRRGRPVEIDVGTLRRGRSATAYHAVVRQGDSTLVDASAWVADAWGEPAEAAAPPPPNRCPAPDGAVAGLADRRLGRPRLRRPAGHRLPVVVRGVRPGHAPDRAVGPHGRRPRARRYRAAPFAQIGDVLHADAHLFDAPAQVTGSRRRGC